LNNLDKFIPIIFFISVLALGLSIFDDYGVHWDEYNNQKFGHKWYEYSLRSIENKKPASIEVNRHDTTHGPFIEISLVALEKLFNLKDSREIILLRHFCTFLIFLTGAVAFYFLNKKIFKKWEIAFLGLLIFILHPRIFAHSFYNTTDIAFMVMYLISALTLIYFIKNQTYAAAIFHSITCAILVDIRIAGLVVPLCTFVFFFIEFIKQSLSKKILYIFTVYGLALILILILIWPYLWYDPINNFLAAISESSFRKLKPAPWNYNFIYIAVTTPVLYIVLFFTGFIGILIRLFKNPRSFYEQNRAVCITFFLLVFPLILPILVKSHLFDEWRHHYFVYPTIIIIALFGLRELLAVVNLISSVNKRKIVVYVLLIILITSLINTFYFMYRNHPYQYTYSNILAGSDKKLGKVDGTLDYWGLSYKQLFEYIISYDDKPKIRIAYKNKPGLYNIRIMTPEVRHRIRVSHKPQADYYITNYRKHNSDDIPKNFIELHKIYVDKITIAGVYKRIIPNSDH